jgi:hypothetical protein
VFLNILVKAENFTGQTKVELKFEIRLRASHLCIMY